MGDLNSYAMEDPIDAIKAGSDDVAGTGDDYTNLIAEFEGPYAYSYTFDGQAGYLDHALASATIGGQVTGAAEWHINSDEPERARLRHELQAGGAGGVVRARPVPDVGSRRRRRRPRPDQRAAGRQRDAYTTAEDTTLEVSAPGVLSNDSDAEGQPLTAALVSGPAHGTLTLRADGSFSYVPAPNYFGADSFTYTANDGVLSSGAVTVSIQVTAVNDAPLARPDTLNVPKNGSATVDALANDTDVDGDTLTVVAFTQGRHGERQVQRREPSTSDTPPTRASRERTRSPTRSVTATAAPPRRS